MALLIFCGILCVTNLVFAILNFKHKNIAVAILNTIATFATGITLIRGI